MADLHTYKKLPSDPCLTQEQITAYIDGKLSSAEQHACEAHMADCGMCEDAVEGLALVKDRSVLAAPLTTVAAPAEGKVIPLQGPNRRMIYAIAAVLVLVLGATFMIRMMSDVNEDSSMAENKMESNDSSVLAPGEGYALENEKTVASDSVGTDLPATSEMKNNDLKKSDAESRTEGRGPVHAPEAVVVTEAPLDAMDETPVEDLRQDGDADDAYGGGFVDKNSPVTKPESPKAATEEISLSEKEEKKTLFDFAKDGIASGSTLNRAEKQKSNAYVDQDRQDNGAAGAKQDNITVTQTAPQTQAPAVGENLTFSNNASGGVVAGNADTSVVVTGTVVMTDIHDSVVVADQLELSYQNGLNQLNAGQANNAIVLFDKVLANKNHARYEDAEYQKAKALIKANRKEDAKALLKVIEAKKGKHAGEATELLKTL